LWCWIFFVELLDFYERRRKRKKMMGRQVDVDAVEAWELPGDWLSLLFFAPNVR
jgi:hypothetical protein